MSDFQYMVECTTKDVINILMKRNGMEMQEAIDLVYTSKTSGIFRTSRPASIFRVHRMFTKRSWRRTTSKSKPERNRTRFIAKAHPTP